MPIRIHCPNGCLLRMPAERSGKIIRCPGCKSVIAIPIISESEKMSGKPIPFQATLVNLRSANSEETKIVPEQVASSEKRLNQDREYSDFVEDRSIQQLQAIEMKMQEPPLADATDQSLPESKDLRPIDQSVDDELSSNQGQAASIVDEISPLQMQLAQSEQKLQLQRIVDSFEAVPPILVDSDVGSRRRRFRRVKPPEAPSTVGEGRSSNYGNENSSTSWKSRLLNANRDRIVLARLLCFLIMVSAMVCLLPAAIAWFSNYSNQPVSTPRWVFILGFLAAVKCLYAIFIFQVTDWSALKGTSVAMLVIAFLYGLTATGLLIEGGHGVVSDFLQLSHLIAHSATIWAVCMLCLETLIAYASGKEAADWKRSEQLLFEIENQRSV